MEHLALKSWVIMTIYVENLVNFIFSSSDKLMAGTCWRACKCSQKSWADCSICTVEIWNPCEEKGLYFYLSTGLSYFFFHACSDMFTFKFVVDREI